MQGAAASEVDGLKAGAGKALLQLLQAVALGCCQGCKHGTSEVQVAQGRVATDIQAEEARR